MAVSAANWDRGLRKSRPACRDDTVVIAGGKRATKAEILALIASDVAEREALESRVLQDSQASGMSWSQIGSVYGVSREAAHQSFAGDTILSDIEFDALLVHLGKPDEVVPALERAANRARPQSPTG